VIFTLQIILLAVGIFFEHQYAKYVPMALPIIYILIIGPGAFTGTRNINKEQLVLALSKNWVNAEELAKYIQKFWVALEYNWSARSRQNNCVTLSFASIGLSLWYYLSGNSAIAALSLVCGVVLYIMAARVNRPLSIYHDQAAKLSSNPGIRDEWLMAAMSIVAFAELFPDIKKFSFMQNDVLSDEFARQAVNIYRINKL
jgi:hypothetical protein